MAKSVRDELQEKLHGATVAKEETKKLVERYQAELKILEARCVDLEIAVRSLNHTALRVDD